MQEFILESEFENLLLQDTPLLDVRAPVEFSAGSIPGSVNIPILNDAERAQIGIVYKEKGSQAAIELGHQLVSGLIREERTSLWLEFTVKNPKAVLTCFRGGMRSQLAQEWLKEQATYIPRLNGGYKAMRSFLLSKTEEFCRTQTLVLVCGYTGAGKTDFLKKNKNKLKVIDLENLASHRGSAFGANSLSQPCQSDFENKLAVEMIKIMNSDKQGPVYIENESRTIGKCVVPGPLFELMGTSEILMINTDISKRAENIFQEYVLSRKAEAPGIFIEFQEATKKISRKLGGSRTQEVLRDIQNCQMRYLSQKNQEALEENKVWIKKLLDWYYDPLYAAGLRRKMAKEISP